MMTDASRAPRLLAADEYLEQARRWGARYGRESRFDYAEGLRQHLGHGYPREPLLQNALDQKIKFGP